MRSALVALAAVLPLIGGSPSFAEEPAVTEDPNTAVARARFSEGETLYRARDYEKALVAFQSAREGKELAAVDFNIARCLDRLGRWQEAMDAYQQFVRAAKLEGTSPKETVDEASDRIGILKARLAARGTLVESAPVAKPGEAKAAVPAVAESKIIVSPDEAPSELAPIVLGVAALGALGAGIGFYVSARNDHDGPLLACKGLCDPNTVQDAMNREELGDVLMVIGALLVVGETALITHLYRRAHREGTAWIAPTVGGLIAGGRF